ncbi:MAG: hypothetical protein AB1540_04970 [Bdellovibrionota bacterium]
MDAKSGRAKTVSINRKVLASYYRRILPLAQLYFENRPVVFLRALTLDASDCVVDVNASLSELMRSDESDVVEIQAMNFLWDKPHYPDWMVLNFMAADREDSGKLIDVATVAQDLLDELKLGAVWKVVSGRRGLDLMVPIERNYETVVVFDFSKMLAEMIYERAPTLSILKKPLELQSERVLIDYHNNHLHQPCLSPFSPQVSAQLQLSLPVSYEALEHKRRLPVFSFDDVTDEQLNHSKNLLETALETRNDLEPAFIAIEAMVSQAL